MAVGDIAHGLFFSFAGIFGHLRPSWFGALRRHRRFPGDPAFALDRNRSFCSKPPNGPKRPPCGGFPVPKTFPGAQHFVTAVGISKYSLPKPLIE